MTPSQLRLNPFRAVPVAFALIFNVVFGPLAPAAQTLLTGPQTALAYVGDSSTFELDGNAFHAGSSHDWDQVYADRNGPPFSASDANNVVFATDITGAGDDILTGGSTKDTIDISSWLWNQTSSTSVQDKDDIENAFAAAYTATNGHTVGYFGLDRYSISGDATAGFWFFKNDIAKTNTPSQGGFEFSGQHAEGDILVVIDFVNGGSSGEATVYYWHNGGLVLKTTGGECDGSSQEACAITNTQDENSPWAYTPKSGTDGVFPAAPIKQNGAQGAGALYEGGVDLTALGLDTGCFSSFMAETRSSQEPTSTLSDFVLGNFSFCAPPTIETQVSDSSLSVGDTVTDTATLSGDKGAVEGSVDFFLCGPGNSAPDCATGGTQVGATKTISNGEATSDPYEADTAGWYCFRAEYTPAEGSKYLEASHTNKTTECFQVKPAEVHVAKAADAASVSAGDPIGFTVTVSNTGTGTAKGVSLTDALPGGNAGHDVHWVIDTSKYDFASFALSGADGSQQLTLAGQPITLLAGASLKVHITAATDKTSCATYNNTASVSSTNDGSDEASASTEVLCPAVHVTKTADAASVSAGDPIGFTVTISNTGDGEAKGLSFSDTLPGGAGIDWSIDPASAGWSITGSAPNQSLAYAGTTLAAGGSSSVHVVSNTTKDSCKEYDNTASVSATNDGSDEASASTEVLCPALTIEKTADASPVNAGDAIGFTITVSNSSAEGTGTAKSVTLSDPLPAGVTWTISPAYAGPGTCSIDGSQTLNCSFGDLEPGDSVSVHVSATTSAQACSTYPNTATAEATNHPEVQASATIECLAPEIHVTKTADAGTVNAGDPIGFTVTISNTGEGTAYDVHLDDALPGGNGGSPVTWSIDNSQFDHDAFTITGAAGSQSLSLKNPPVSMAAGASLKVHITASTTKANCATYDNLAEVSTSNDGSDEDTASTVVQCPGLNIAKTAADTSINGGDQASFTITVWNTGPGTAYNVTLNDPLPGGLAWTDDSNDCSISGGTLSCDFGDLGVTTKDNTPAKVTVTAPTTREDCGTLDNLATASADNNDDVTAEASIDVTCPVIRIQKVNDTTTSVLPGTTVTYTLTVTVEDGPALNAEVVDTLPAGLDDPTEISDGGAWNGTDRTITWQFASLDGMTELTYKAKVSAGDTQGQVLENVVVVTSPNTQCPDTETLGDECTDVSDVTVRVPTLVIGKTASIDEVHFVFNADGSLKSVTPADRQVTWTLSYTLTNGPVTDAVICDPLPDSLTFVSASDGGAIADGSGACAAGEVEWDLGTLTDSGFVTVVTTVNEDAPDGLIDNVATISSSETPSDTGEDSIRVTSEQVEAATPTPKPSVPNTALVLSQNGEPIQVPVELLVLVLISSLGVLTLVNVKAVRRRR